MKAMIRSLLFLPVFVLAEINMTELLNYLPENPVVIDAGAHDGRTTLELSRLWPNGTIHAFEPVPQLFSDLQRRTSNSLNIKTYNVALGHEKGTAIFYVSQGRGDGSSSLLEPKDHLVHFPDVKFPKKISV